MSKELLYAGLMNRGKEKLLCINGQLLCKTKSNDHSRHKAERVTVEMGTQKIESVRRQQIHFKVMGNYLRDFQTPQKRKKFLEDSNNFLENG